MSVRKRTHIVAAVSGLGILVAGLGLLIPSRGVVDGEPTRSAVTSSEEGFVFPVKTAVVRGGPLRHWVRASGHLRSGRTVEVTSRVTARVEAVMVREGMVLRCGDTAVVFDGTEFRLAYERARLTLLGAQIEYKSLSASPYLNQPDSVRRERELHHAEDRFAAAVARHGTGSMPDDEFGVEEREHAATLAYLTARREDVVSHRSGLAIARELAERARRESEGAIVRAAFDGAVANCMITPGAPVTQGQALFTLVDLSEQFLEAEVLENDISEIRVGRPAQITVHAIDGPPVWGRVASINPVANPSTGTMRVSVRVIPGGGATVMFRPGMLASVRIAAAVDSGVVLIPFSALMYRDSRPVVFVVEQDRALWRFVRPGRTNGEDRGIVSGLSPGEQVIIEGQATLGHDARVRVME